MSEIEKNYNFDEDEAEVNAEAKPEVVTHERDNAKQEKKRAIVRNRISIWDQIKPMLHYYIIAVIAFGIAGYMMYNAYKTLYPAQKVVENQAKNLSFSNVNSSPANSFGQSENATPAFSTGSVDKKTIVNNHDQAHQASNFISNSVDKKTAALMHRDIKETNKRLSVLEEQLSALTKEVKILAVKKDKTQDIATKFDQLNQSVNEIAGKENNNVTALYQQIEMNRRALMQLEKLAEENNSTVKLMLANQYNHREKLSLRAIITGRAWLVNHAGVTYTVTQGSQIPGYGKVVKVDDSKEQVVMSSGYIFK